MIPAPLLCAFALLAVVVVGCGEGQSESATRSVATETVRTGTARSATDTAADANADQGGATTPARLYLLGPTVACLKARRVAVTVIAPRDTRLRAMRDLAQRTSRQARSGRQVVGLAVGRTTNDATLLVELLRVPKDPYRLERLGNAVLLYRPVAAQLRTIVRSCLR